jgi:hypothetical protein
VSRGSATREAYRDSLGRRRLYAPDRFPIRAPRARGRGRGRDQDPEERDHPPRLQIVNWRDELPADDAAQRAVEQVLLLTGSWDEAAASKLFTADTDRGRIRKDLARLGVDHTGCVAERGIRRVEQEPLGDDTQTSIFQLSCQEGPLEPELGIDAASGRIGHLFGHSPRDPDAVCWQ